jgi:hypothetical protein
MTRSESKLTSKAAKHAQKLQEYVELHQETFDLGLPDAEHTIQRKLHDKEVRSLEHEKAIDNV